MSGFENFAAQAEQIEHEIARHGIAIGIDWNDQIAVDQLARDAIACRPEDLARHFDEPDQRARYALFGLAQLMLQVMEESAREKIHTHGGPVWKQFGRALWRAWQAHRGLSDTEAPQQMP